MSDLRICFAYNDRGLRCMQPAGHEGNHAHAIEWTDAECFDPADLIPIPAQPTPPFVGDVDEIARQVAAAEAKWEARELSMDTEALAELDFGHPAIAPVLVDSRCVACDHQHSGGKCRCGCETFIPRLT
jgi:hypothetical protein